MNDSQSIRSEDDVPSFSQSAPAAPVTSPSPAIRAGLERMQRSVRPGLVKDGTVLGITATVLLTLSKRFMAPALGYDEQFFVWGGWSILKGLVPYKEFLEHKPPIAFLTHAIGLFLFGFEGHGYRIFFRALTLVAVLGWQASLLSRRVDRVLVLILGLALVYLHVNPTFHDSSLDDTESIGLAYYFIGAALFVANTRHRRWFDILGGAFMAACVLSKEPFVFAVFPTWLTVPFLRTKRFDRATAIAYVRDTTIGVGAIAVACCVYMIPTGSMTHYLAMLNRYRIMFRDPAKGYCVVLGRFRPTGIFLEDLGRQWDMIEAAYFNTRVLGFLLPLFLSALALLPARSKPLAITSLLTVAGALYATTPSNCYWPHYFTMAHTGIFFFLGAGAIAMTEYPPLRRRPLSIWTWLVLGFPVLWQMWPALRIERIANYVPQPDADPVPGAIAFVKEHTTPEDRIFTTGPPGFYVLTNRIAATRTSSVSDEIIESFPGQTDEEKTRPLYDDLVEHRPKVVILDPENGHRKRRYMAAAITPFLQTYKYEKVGEFFYLRP